VEPINVTDDMISQSIRFLELDEECLFEIVGGSFATWENLQNPNLARRELARLHASTYLRDLEAILSVYLPPKHALESLADETIIEGSRWWWLESREDLIKKKGKKYFRKFKRKLYRKICVEKEACKWTKDILGDSKALLRELIPLVGVALGLTIPAIVITVAILIIKWGIITFCKCPKP
jgi:hypothetical protein